MYVRKSTQKGLCNQRRLTNKLFHLNHRMHKDDDDNDDEKEEKERNEI